MQCIQDPVLYAIKQEVPKRAPYSAAGKGADIYSEYFSPSNLLTLYKAQIRPRLEYGSHIWGAAAPTALSTLDAVQRRAIRLIGDPALTCHLQSLSYRRAERFLKEIEVIRNVARVNGYDTDIVGKLVRRHSFKKTVHNSTTFQVERDRPKTL
nr:unnamed protein product [Callosobruchus chinensis]